MDLVARTILIIDDCPEDRELYRRYLLRDQDYSYTVLEASLGQDGLELWQQQQPDIILLDYRLPDLDGLEFLAQMQSSLQQPYLPVIMVTGQGNEAIAVQAMKAGAQDYLVKEQITPEGLHLAVSRAIETMQLRTQLQQQIERERLVAQITRKIHHSLNLEEILQTTVTEVRQFLQTDRVLIFRLQSDGWGTVITESVGAEWIPLLSTSLYDPCFNERYLEAFQQGLVTIKPDIHDGSIDPCQVELLANLQVRSNLVVPILQDSRLWGMLIAHHCATSRQWQSLEVDLLKELGIHVGIALQQAELYQQVQDDLAERKRIEAALRNNEQLLHLALAGAQAGSWDWELATGKLTWSVETYHLYGLDPAKSLPEYEGWYNHLLHPDDRVRVNAEVSRVIEQRLPALQIEFRILHPQHGIRWLVSLGRLTFDEQGSPIRLSGINLDITDRKQTEALLQENQIQLLQQLAEIELIYQTAPIGLSILDADLRFVRINQRLAEMNGLPVEAHIGRTIREILPDLADTAEQILRPILETGEPLFNVEIQGETPAQPGVKHTWLEHFLPLKQDDRVVGISTVCEEITERLGAEAALRESEERFRQMAETISDVFWIMDIEQERVLYISPAFERIWGRPREQLYQEWGAGYAYIHPDDQEQVAAIAAQAMQTYGFDMEYRIVRPDGTVRYLRDRGFVAPNEYGQLTRLVGVAQDITDRKLAEQEREQLLQREQAAREEAERASRVKDEFLAILSHELRSPLNPILGWTKLLQTGKFDTAKTAQALATIERNAKLQTQLIDDLLDIAKILRGKLSMNIAPVDPVFVIEEAIETVRAAAIAKNILLHPVLPHIGQVAGDEARLQQIVWNLLSNAVKFTPDNGRVEIRLEQIGNQAQITVSDTGKGIKPDFLPYIFESFRQEDASTTRKFGGLGLGLAIVRHLVEAHGGTISANSPGEGQGATFTVRFPLLNPTLEGNPSEPLSKPALDVTGVRVLAIDDEPDARELLTVLLTQYGAEVVAVASPAEVLATLESFQPDVLISDIGMPDADGYTLIRQIRALPSQQGGQTPAIALTAYAREEDSQQAIASGYQWHITKPLDPEQLVRAVMALTHLPTL
jgi:PAS domain S-box-containing protein